MRIAVYTDYAYSRSEHGIHADRAFALFLGRLGALVDGMVIVGRLRPGTARARYPLPAEVDFVALPYYESLARPLEVARVTLRSLARFWRTLDDVDCCWLLGPHPLAIGFAAMAAIRGRRVFLGVRQDLPAYARNRHPGRRSFALAAALLDRIYRALAKRCPTVVVGPALRQAYGGSRRLLEIAVSLVEPEQIVAVDQAMARSYDDAITVLSVGRIDKEKNPLMLAEILARLAVDDDPWRLALCGEGELEAPLRRRLEELRVADRAELRGYVPHGRRMIEAYRSSHVLLHVSLTEGLPQVILEAFAAGLPVVATDVGGIREAVGDAALLIPPEDAEAAVEALRRIASDAILRRELIEAGMSYVGTHTLDAEAERVAAFLRSDAAV